ncbi:single-stranded DNA-binding protein [Oryzobacter telluris]|uniref:single-stranded DNA-binding protein n=1 Tax=Oryzobacter telluris TaxID=3149179 RepID=UPI00370DA30F
MNETYVTIRGRLVADPAVRTTRAGGPMTVFRIASSVRRPVQGQQGAWEDADTTFYDVVTYKALAANAGVSLRKGHPVSVHGRQHVRSWQKDDGSTWWGVEVIADAVGHDLTYGTTAFSRVGRGQEGDGYRRGPAVDDGAVPPELEAPDAEPYVVEEPPGRGLGEVAAPDSGPLVRPGDEAAA